MRTFLRTILVAAIAATTIAATEGPSTTAEITSATQQGQSIAVQGKGTFVGPTLVVGSRAPGGTGLPGTNIVEASITPVSNTTLQFDLKVADLAAGTNGTPEAVNYWWEFDVNTNGQYVATYALQAWRTSTAADLTCGVIFLCPPGNPGDPRFQLSTCQPDPTTGNETCSAQALQGQIVGDTFRWNVPRALIGVGNSSELVAVQNITASAGGSGLYWYSNGNGGRTMPWDGYTYERTVSLGIAPAGTPDAEVPLTTTATIATNSNFSGTLATPATPGEYKVVAKACLGANNCTLTSRAVTVS